MIIIIFISIYNIFFNCKIDVDLGVLTSLSLSLYIYIYINKGGSKCLKFSYDQVQVCEHV